MRDKISSWLQRTTSFVVLVICFLSFTTVAEGQGQRAVLANGLTVLIKENHTLPIVTTMLFYKFGSRNEPLGDSGRAHMTEHMMFKGSRQYGKGEMDAIVRKAGGWLDAKTTMDFTSYSINLPAKEWTTALAIEADRLRDCNFEPTAFEAEKKVVVEEGKMRLDLPFVVFKDKLKQVACQGQPYSNLLFGHLEDVAAFSLTSVKKFYDLYYQPNNAVLVVVGDIQSSKALRQITKFFGPIPRGPTPPPITNKNWEQKQSRKLESRADVPYSIIEITFQAPACRSQDGYAMRLLNHVLTNGKCSLLNKKLVIEQPYFHEVFSDYPETMAPYLIFVAAELKTGVKRTKAEQILLQELENLKTVPLADQEIEQAKNQIEAEFVFLQENIQSQANFIGQSELLSASADPSHYLQGIEAVTSQDIQRVAQKYFINQRRTIGWLLPDSE